MEQEIENEKHVSTDEKESTTINNNNDDNINNTTTQENEREDQEDEGDGNDENSKTSENDRASSIPPSNDTTHQEQLEAADTSNIAAIATGDPLIVTSANDLERKEKIKKTTTEKEIDDVEMYSLITKVILEELQKEGIMSLFVLIQCCKDRVKDLDIENEIDDDDVRLALAMLCTTPLVNQLVRGGDSYRTDHAYIYRSGYRISHSPPVQYPTLKRDVEQAEMQVANAERRLKRIHTQNHSHHSKRDDDVKFLQGICNELENDGLKQLIQTTFTQKSQEE